MKLAIVMDHPSQIKPYKDSTVAMILAAQAMDWTVHFLTLEDLYSSQGHAFGKMSAIKITDDKAKDWAEIKAIGDIPLADYDIIIMRKDPPFDIEYIYATYTLDLAEKAGVLVANKPQSLRDANEKFFTLHFPQCCPETLVSRDMHRLTQFWATHQKVIFKPLEGMGGKSVFFVDEQGLNLPVILETLTKNQSQSIMAQKFIPEIYQTGDKRVLLVDGKPISHALARIPAKGDMRGNLAAGAKGVVQPLTERDYWIASQVGPTLKKMGLYFVGIDIIGDYLTEINVTSPTCIREIEAETNLTIAKDLLVALASKIK
ncbi:glutathione synthase [Legionella sp. W05-934-2]|jgi:glutathione synthase|uniref:glutathione synthase n=1 Tax=Legionella sp. W05-934-2 TaxID=1198649 RepID=UPI003462747B